VIIIFHQEMAVSKIFVPSGWLTYKVMNVIDIDRSAGKCSSFYILSVTLITTANIGINNMIF